jgi:L-fuculose-phosphate aldolase
MNTTPHTTIEANDEAIAQARERIAHIGRLLFDRHLTDAAGGNISVRVGDRICISPRYSGSLHQWQLEPEDVLVADLDRNILFGSGQLSRESNVHFKLHRDFGEWGSSVIHAHARNLLVFAVLGRPLPPVLEATRKFGETPTVAYAPAHSPQLAENVAASLRGREARIKNQAAGVIAPWHGLFVMGKDLDAAFDAVERLDNNATILMMASAFAGAEAVAQSLKDMETVISNYKEG